MLTKLSVLIKEVKGNANISFTKVFADNNNIVVAL